MAKTSGYVAKKQQTKGIQRTDNRVSEIIPKLGFYQNLTEPLLITLQKPTKVRIEINMYLDHHGGLTGSDLLLAANVNGSYHNVMYNNCQDSLSVHIIKSNGSLIIDLPQGVNNVNASLKLLSLTPATIGAFGYQFATIQIFYLD